METTTNRLVQNALDFAVAAVKGSERDNRVDWNSSILSLACALELILKARLADEHWALLFARVDDATMTKLESGDFVSVNSESVVSRLENIADVQFDQKTKNDLKALRQLRNRITHFHEEFNKDSVRSVAAKGLALFVRFCENEMVPHGLLDEVVVQDFVRTVELDKFAEFVAERLKSIKPKLNESYRPQTNYFVECDDCLQDAAIVDGSDVVCLFCGDKCSVELKAAMVSDDSRARECPKCTRSGWVVHKFSDTGEEAFECIICGHHEGREKKWWGVPRLRFQTDQG